jgi:hypothetical protein
MHPNFNDKQPENVDFINIVNNTYEFFKKYLTTINDAINTTETKDEIHNRYDNNVKFPQTFLNKYVSIKKMMSEIYNLEIIKYTFFSDNIVSQNLEKTVQEYFNTNFKEYEEFKTLVKSFLYPNRTTNNFVLNGYIENFNNGKPNEFQTFLNNLKSETIDNITELLKVSYDIYLTHIDTTKPKYECHIYLDLMEGKLTKNMIESNKCKLRDATLVDIFEQFKYKKQGSFRFDKMNVLSMNDFVSNEKKEDVKVGGKKTRKMGVGFHKRMNVVSASRFRNIIPFSKRIIATHSTDRVVRRFANTRKRLMNIFRANHR